MTKFWALIVSNRPHVFALGPHENADAAMKFADNFCDQRTQENENANEARRHNNAVYDADEDLPTYELVYLMDEDDLRALTGEVHRPRGIARQRKEVAVEAPTKHQCKDASEPADA